MRKDRIWVHENIDEIIQLICAVEDKKLLKQELKERFALKEFQIKKLLSMRLDMLSKDDYVKDIEKQKVMEVSRVENNGWNPTHHIKWYSDRIREEKNKINEYNAYITIAEKYQDISEVITDNPKLCDHESILKEKYGLDRRQAMLIKSVTIDDLISVDIYREEVKNAEEEITRLENDLEEYKSEVSEK